MNMFVGLCLCVREKIVRSEEKKKEKKNPKNPMKRNGKRRRRSQCERKTHRTQ